MKAEIKGRWSLLGIIVSALYVFLVVVAYAFAATGKPSGLGYEWIPFITIAMPWYDWVPNYIFGTSWYYAILRELIILGIILNAGILYLLVTFLEKVLQRLFRKK